MERLDRSTGSFTHDEASIHLYAITEDLEGLGTKAPRLPHAIVMDEDSMGDVDAEKRASP